MTDTIRNTRPLYILGASGRNEFGGRWKCVNKNAFLEREAAEAAMESFLRVCREPTGSLNDPMPDTVTTSVSVLDLQDDLIDGEAEHVILVHAKGPSAVFNGYFQAMSNRAFTVQEAAETWAENEFRANCINPDISLEYSQEEGLQMSFVRLELCKPSPAPKP